MNIPITYRPATRRPLKLAWFTVLLGLLGGLLAALGPSGQASAAPTSEPGSRAAGYSYYQTDSFRFWDSTGNKVGIQGKLEWYKDGYLAPVFRGQFRNDSYSYAVLNTTGCLWVKVTWRKVTGTASWPPSASANTVSDGYYRKCGGKGTGVYLKGIAYASHALFGATVCIGYSFNSSYTLRRYDACQAMYN